MYLFRPNAACATITASAYPGQNRRPAAKRPDRDTGRTELDDTEIRKTEPQLPEKRQKGEKRRRFSKPRLILAAVIALILIALIIKLAVYLGGISKAHLSDDGLTHAIRNQNSVVIHGIDVSEHQDDINWKKVKSSEADFAFIRAGYRSADTGELHEDEEFGDNIKGAARAGVSAGAYFFSQALNEEEAVEEADFLLDIVDRYDVDMPLVIDFELYEGGRLNKAIEAGDLPAASLYHDIVIAFCDRVEEVGYESAVYANYNMLTNYMDSSILDDYETIWAAQYGGVCHVKGNYMYWQCAEDAQVGGIEGPVDHDIWYMEPGTVYKTAAKGKKDAVSIGECRIDFDKDSYKLKSHRAKPKVTVSYKGSKLHEGKDYILTLVKNTVPGTGYAIVRGIGKYKDWTGTPFTIE